MYFYRKLINGDSASINNGTHLSAGPFEALKEQILGFQLPFSQTVLGSALLREGLREENLRWLTDNPPFTILKDGLKITKPLFDWTKNMTIQEAVEFITAYL